ncbi:MAG: NADH-quinone oxidoreductase subunit NuoE [Cyclobacteriaceae bacterium]|nr:NADH-quinone oxidoreductase subunit NuoE [Cyclobacteriaceae bacterium]
MLTEEEIHEITEEINRFPVKKAACIEALKVIQKHRRWVSDESIEELAEMLEMSPGEIDDVATFYNLVFRKPVGRHVILICDSVSCYIMGYQQILQHLKVKLGIVYGETTRDDRFTLLPIPCLGTCDHAPAFMIDEDLHRDLTPENIDDILTKYK